MKIIGQNCLEQNIIGEKEEKRKWNPHFEIFRWIDSEHSQQMLIDWSMSTNIIQVHCWTKFSFFFFWMRWCDSRHRCVHPLRIEWNISKILRIKLIKSFIIWIIYGGISRTLLSRYLPMVFLSHSTAFNGIRSRSNFIHQRW